MPITAKKVPKKTDTKKRKTTIMTPPMILITITITNLKEIIHIIIRRSNRLRWHLDITKALINKFALFYKEYKEL